MSQAFSHCVPQRRPELDPLPAHLRFVNTVALRQVFLRALRFPAVNAIPILIMLLSKGQAGQACDSSSKSKF
jgi:hypothetical protein